MNANPLKLTVGIPNLDSWNADCAVAFSQMCLALQKHPVSGYGGLSGLHVANVRSSNICGSRKRILDDARKIGDTHVLFIDSDQAFPPQLVHMLARHGKRVIGCNIATKHQGSSMPTARLKPAPGEWYGGHRVYSNGKKGCQQVWRLGFGVMLIELSVLDKIKTPWFEIRWDEQSQDYEGEDWYFCRRLEDAGIPIWVEHEASQLIDHVGTWRYGHDGVVQEQKKEAA